MIRHVKVKVQVNAGPVSGQVQGVGHHLAKFDTTATTATASLLLSLLCFRQMVQDHRWPMCVTRICNLQIANSQLAVSVVDMYRSYMGLMRSRCDKRQPQRLRCKEQ